MYFTEFDPAPELAAHVSAFWSMRVDAIPDRDEVARAEGHMHVVVPDGCANLIATKRQSGEVTLTVQGVCLNPITVPVWPGDQFWGVRFWPDVGSLFLGRSAVELRDSLQPAQEFQKVLGLGFLDALMRVADSTDESDVAEILNTALLERVRDLAEIDTVVRAVVLAIIAGRGETSVSELARDMGFSQRQLQRRFKRSVGLTQKQFARIRRLRTSLGPLLKPSPVSWAAVAADMGFSDQSHLIREFVSLAGATPTELAARIRAIGHGRVRP